jgi:integrase/recombinase XerD
LAHAGHGVPRWEEAPQKPAPAPIIADYITFARDHRGLATSGLVHDQTILSEFVGSLKDWRQVNIVQIDRHLQGLMRDYAPATVCRAASAIRSWLRFLHATNRLQRDLSSAVLTPVRRRYNQPPRARPWREIRKMVRATNTKTAIGLRDRAQFLLMSAYGLGSAEVVGLRFENIDWRNRCLRITRQKTKAPINLPLLPAVARALAAYIRRGRPKLVRSPFVFLSTRRPFPRATETGMLRHRVREAAHRAGIQGAVLGAHLFRHSHATRHLEIGTPMKVLGDILGHRDPEVTSIYTRAAVQHLRRLALPVPV